MHLRWPSNRIESNRVATGPQPQLAACPYLGRKHDAISTGRVFLPEANSQPPHRSVPRLVISWTVWHNTEFKSFTRDTRVAFHWSISPKRSGFVITKQPDYTALSSL